MPNNKKTSQKSNQTSQLVDILDHPVVETWMINYININPLGLARLIGNNEDRLKQIYGSPKMVDKNNVLYWQDQWRGINLIIATSSSGTIIKANVIDSNLFFRDQKIGGAIINFLLYLINLLCGNLNKTFDE